MRRNFSPSKARKTEDNPPIFIDREPVRDVRQWKHFCHYNNGVYMGGMSGSHKNGKGLLLHDDGASVITEYKNDIPAGHNVIFRENSITSIVFKSEHQYDIAYKVGRFIIKIPFHEASDKANGVGCLIDYEAAKLFEVVFENGAVVQKILRLDRKDNEDVFKRNAITKTVGVKHEQAFELTFEKPENMHVKCEQSQLTIGYYNQEGELHGLGFKLYAENAEVSGARSLYLKTIERGYYRNSVLETYGEKYFSNGNKYVGEFEGGEYSGQGILICPQEMKWAYGEFVGGRLSEVIDSNSQRHTQNDFDMWVDSLEHIHRRHQERWIDLHIELPDELYLFRLLNDATRMRTTSVDPDREETYRRDEQRLNKIQHQFIEGSPGNVERSYVDQELDQHYTYRSHRQHFDSPHKERMPPTPKRTQETNYFSSPKGERHYRLEDPFKEELLFRQPSYRAVERREHPEYSQYEPKRKYLQEEYPRFRYYDDISSRYKEEEPLESIYRPTYRHRFQTQRERLRKLEDEDYEYLRKSPVHRKYYDSSYLPSRYSGRIINKRSFNYKDPTGLYVHRWPEEPTTPRLSPRRYEYQQPTRQSPPRYKANPNQLSNSRNYVENNYKYWR